MSSKHPDFDKLRELFSSYFIAPLSHPTMISIISNRRRADDPTIDEEIHGGGYDWDETEMCYKNKTGNQILFVFFADGEDKFLWSLVNKGRSLSGIGKILKNVDKLRIWIHGRSEIFLKELADTGAEVGGLKPPTSIPKKTPEIYHNSPKRDETDNLILKLKSQAKSEGGLPSDLMIDLGIKAKKENNEKMLNFLKTMKPMEENTIKKSYLGTLIREIVKGILKEGFDLNYGISDDKQLISLANKVWGNDDWKIDRSKRTEYGKVYKMRGNKNRQGIFFLWNTPDGKWKYLNVSDGKKWIDIPSTDPELDEMTGTGAVAGYSTPFAFKKQSKRKTMENNGISEMTTTGDVAGYNIPGSFAKKGGSKKGIDVSSEMGYELTPIGRKEMNRTADKL